MSVDDRTPRYDRFIGDGIDGTFASIDSIDTPPPLDLDSLARELERQNQLYGEPARCIRAGANVIEALRELPAVPGMPSSPSDFPMTWPTAAVFRGISVFPSLELAADEWAPVFRLRKK